MKSDKQEKVRITITIPQESAKRIQVMASKYSIPKTAYIIQATMEKVTKEEKQGREDNLKIQ